MKLAIALILLLAGWTSQSHAQQAAASKYCMSTGGAVVVRAPLYGTNGSDPLRLSGSQDFCQYTSKADGSSISLLLSTLVATKPSLAALAYYAQTPFSGSCEGSPGSCYCSQLGGTDLFGGITAAGGGWAAMGNHTDVLDACIFPDLSSIDSYGLFYHSAGIVRGIDLSTVLRYKNP
jgi:hypothetical protein